MTALSPEHREELNGSRIGPDLIGSRGYCTVGSDWRERLREMGCPQWAVRDDSAFPGLVLPMYRPRTGEYIGFQFKPGVPQPKPGSDKPVKYVSPKGMHNRLDVHPGCRDRVNDPAAPLWITEGVKKSDALASRGLAAVTLTGVWNWRNQEGSLGDWEDVPLKGRTVVVCFDSDAPSNPQVRNAMVRLVGWLRSRGATAYYLPVPDRVGATAVKGVDDYLAAGGDLEGLRAAASECAPETANSRDASFSDAFLTDTVCSEALSGHFLFARGLGWMRYAGNVWASADDPQVVEEIRQWAKARWEEIVEEYKRDQSRDVKARMDGWRQVLTNGRLRALASLARGPLHADASDFDADPDLLNCPNGVVDLRTGELMDPDPQFLMTKVTSVPYDPDAGDADFRAALCALPEELHSWYQVRMGQAFTGHPSADDLMIVQQGGGRNGKSTLTVPLKKAAGSYYTLVSDRVVMGSSDQHPTEMMELRGARYALMEETPEARQLNMQQVKRTVGTPDITARHIRQDSVTFPATHSLFINTNFTPAVVETDLGTWRRLALVRFPYTFRSRQEDVRGPDDRAGDDGLRERCALADGPAEAALAWVVAGAVRWYAGGRHTPALPQRVVDDTTAWRREGDLVMGFADERLEFDQDAKTPTSDMFQEFSRWLTGRGHKPWTQKTLHSRLGEHDLMADHRVEFRVVRVKDKTQRMWCGVRLVPDEGGGSMMPSISPFAG